MVAKIFLKLPAITDEVAEKDHMLIHMINYVLLDWEFSA